MRYAAPGSPKVIDPYQGQIGIPRTLGYHTLRGFFDRLLKAHDFGLVVSPPSSKQILEWGLRQCIDEVCFPLKVFFGHVEALARQGVDTLLIPRLCSTAKGRNHCPKFHVLPDLIEQAFPSLNILAPYIDLHHSRRPTLKAHLFDACRPLLSQLGRWTRKSPQALEGAWRSNDEPPVAVAGQAPDLTIALVGHPYVEADDFLNLGITRILKGQGVEVVTTPELLSQQPVPLEREMYYESSVRAARAIEHHLANRVHGILLPTFFACGPDSYTTDTFLYRLAAQKNETPIMRLIIDEHTAVEGLVTRIATFVELARQKREDRPGRC